MEQRPLSDRQKKVVDYIASHPGVKSNAIDNYTKWGPSTTAAVLSSIVKEQPNLLHRDRTSGPGGVFVYRLANGQADSPGVPLQPRRTRRDHRRPGNSTEVDVLLTIKIGKKEAITLSVNEARDLFHQLLSLQRYFEGAK